MAELDPAVRRWRINNICVLDDTFAVNRTRFFALTERIKALAASVPWEIRWFCQFAVNSLDEQVLVALRDSGCHMVAYGFESYSPQVLKSMRKPITPVQIDFAIKETIKSGMAVSGNFIFGDVAETASTAKETLDYWKGQTAHLINIGFVRPYPGSALYKHCRARGVIKDPLDFIKGVAALSADNRYRLNMTEGMSDGELAALEEELQQVRLRYRRYVPLMRKRRTGRPGVYALTARCPHCGEVVKYGDILCAYPNFMYETLTCRKCRQRFIAISRLPRLAMKYSPLLKGVRAVLKAFRRD